MTLALAGADPMLRNANGESVYDICTREDVVDVLEFCLKAQAHYQLVSANKVLEALSGNLHEHACQLIISYIVGSMGR